MTLNRIERSLIREAGVFDEPRIDFAVNWAALGCPALRPEALVAGTPMRSCGTASNAFSAIAAASSSRFRVAQILDWQGEDFARRWGSLEDCLRQQPTRVTTEQLGQAANPPKVEFLDYDWSLNQAH